MTSYIVKGDEGTYVYRVYRHQWRDKPAIQFELDVLQHYIVADLNYPNRC
ncbi:hypothetical protein GCM10008934_19320 [Virgibacillus salarius]